MLFQLENAFIDHSSNYVLTFRYLNFFKSKIVSFDINSQTPSIVAMFSFSPSKLVFQRLVKKMTNIQGVLAKV